MAKLVACITAAPREYLDDTLASCKQLGIYPMVFAEPDTYVPNDTPVIQNELRLGLYKNFRKALKWAINQPSDYIFMLQDDVIFSPLAKIELETILKEEKKGMFSFFSSPYQRWIWDVKKGWNKGEPGENMAMAQALLFSKDAAIRLFNSPLFQGYGKDKLIDSLIGRVMQVEKIDCYWHNPGLSVHIGKVSSIGHHW